MNERVYDFRVYVTHPDGTRQCSAFQVTAIVAKEAKWDRVDVCSDSFTAALAGGVTRETAARIAIDRRALAEEIAGGLTEHILKSIESRDLENGYPKEPK